MSVFEQIAKINTSAVGNERADGGVRWKKVQGRGRVEDQPVVAGSSSLFLFSSLSRPLAISVRLSSTGNGNTNFAEYSGRTAVSARWKTVVWVVITWG